MYIQQNRKTWRWLPLVLSCKNIFDRLKSRLIHEIKQVTDNPQILSGSKLAIFDPHHAFTSSGGAAYDFVENPNAHADQLSGFEFFIPTTARTNPFSQTVIRLPLRTTTGAAKSRIKNDAVGPSKIRQLFDDFINDEIDIALLFLTHISTIEIYEVNDQGTVMCLATAKVVKSSPDAHHMSSMTGTTHRCNVNVTTTASDCVSRSWRVLHASWPNSEAAKLIWNRLGYDVGTKLERHKLLPKVGIAIPLPSSSHNGRLYTYLPLPLSTGFPCHIHGLFALTPDRQHLRNGEETGVVEGDDRSAVVLTYLKSVDLLA
jgi:sacsin